MPQIVAASHTMAPTANQVLWPILEDAFLISPSWTGDWNNGWYNTNIDVTPPYELRPPNPGDLENYVVGVASFGWGVPTPIGRHFSRKWLYDPSERTYGSVNHMNDMQFITGPQASFRWIFINTRAEDDWPHPYSCIDLGQTVTVNRQIFKLTFPNDTPFLIQAA